MPADASAEDLITALGRERATLWLARPVQVEAVAAALAAPGAAATDGPGSGAPAGFRSHLAAVVMPLGTLGELAAARSAAERFQAVTGVEAVTAYAPREAGGLVAMNTPLSRRGGDHETTCDPTSVGRVVNGVVVWPAAGLRGRLGFPPLEGVAADRDGCVVVGATLPCPAGRDDEAPRAALLSQAFAIDSDGFLRGV